MSLEPFFPLSTQLVAPFWMLMIFAPKWRWTRRIASSPWIVAPPAILFAVLTVPAIPEMLPVLTQPTLDGMMGIFSMPESMTAAWMYFLAFDLFMGRWIYPETRQRNRSLVWSGIMLFFTLMFGPLGFLVNLVDRTFLGSGTPSFDS
ncbi:MAG: ABA4-like family protein [Anaerolineales bacterium]|jgi:hypothetical protein